MHNLLRISVNVTYLILTVHLQQINGTRCQLWSFQDQTIKQSTRKNYSLLIYYQHCKLLYQMTQSYKNMAYSRHHNVVTVFTQWKSKQFVLHVKNPMSEGKYSIYTNNTVHIILLVCHTISNACMSYIIMNDHNIDQLSHML